MSNAPKNAVGLNPPPEGGGVVGASVLDEGGGVGVGNFKRKVPLPSTFT